jgi:thioredoxin reductase
MPTTTDADLLILGGGPAGLTPGIYAAQAKLKVIVRTRDCSSDLASTDRLGCPRRSASTFR